MKFKKKGWDYLSNMSKDEYMVWLKKQSWYCYREGMKCYYYEDMYDWMLLSWLFSIKFKQLNK